MARSDDWVAKEGFDENKEFKDFDCRVSGRLADDKGEGLPSIDLTIRQPSDAEAKIAITTQSNYGKPNEPSF